MQPKAHWENVYETKPAHTVSWFQEHPEHSLRLIRETGVSLEASIIDVGGGASTLVDDLLSAGYRSLTVLDLSGAAGWRQRRSGWAQKPDRFSGSRPTSPRPISLSTPTTSGMTAPSFIS
jgi:hypothetical protein